ncbi:MAG: ankyrin repeat domain-containing protein, partial [Acidimicrobiia bacterium]|nr:ankyrin repeat domain-containing protein [Acidimicrobiia bacterium]
NARSSGAGITALHSAALANDVELARALVGMGADPDVVDPNYDASPLGWAEHNNSREAADYLRPLTGQGDPSDEPSNPRI